jgi:hypothetical protein
VTGRLAFLLAAACVLAGTAAAAGSSPRDPQKRHNPADQAWARAIRVQRDDLGSGDWRLEHSSKDDSKAPQECKNPNLSDLVETGGAEDPDWSRNGSFIGSGASVFVNASQATAAWNRVAQQPLTQCFADALRQGMAGSGLRLRIESSGPLALPKLAPHFQAGRVQLSLSTSRMTVKGRLSYYLYARDRATAMLMVASFDRPLQPISAGLERRLAELVAKRLSR